MWCIDRICRQPYSRPPKNCRQLACRQQARKYDVGKGAGQLEQLALPLTSTTKHEMQARASRGVKNAGCLNHGCQVVGTAERACKYDDQLIITELQQPGHDLVILLIRLGGLIPQWEDGIARSHGSRSNTEAPIQIPLRNRYY